MAEGGRLNHQLTDSDLITAEGFVAVAAVTMWEVCIV